MRKLHFTLFAFLLPLLAIAQSGVIFRDGNGNGIKDNGERGVPGVTINSYVNIGAGDLALGTAISDTFGRYTLQPSGAAGQKVRLEIVLPTTGCVVNTNQDYEAHQGAAYGTGVQFVDGEATNVNFGIYHLSEYVRNNNPTIFTSVYSAGSSTHPSTTQTGAIMSFPYNSDGIPGDPGVNTPDKLAIFGNVGTTWGIAYSAHANRVFAAAFLKRHAGMGPLGSGGIYMVDPTKPNDSNVTNFFSLDTDLGISTTGTGAYVAQQSGFSPVVGSDADRKLKGITDLTNDAAAFGQVGKVSLGGIELSDDGRYLFVVNLYDRKVYRIDLKDAKNPQKPTAADVKVYDAAAWLTASCPSGVGRPFGIKYHKGMIYVGVTCTGENLATSIEQYSASAANQVLSSSVYAFDPAGNGTGTTALDIPLTYTKDLVSKFDNGLLRGWFNWTDDMAQVTYSHGVNEDSTYSHPQPMLCDIEFDQDGSMIMSYADRLGHQMGWRNFRPNTDTIHKVSCIVSGEILRAWRNPTSCGFELENNATAGPYTTNGKNKNYTYGGTFSADNGEFYFGDDAYTLNGNFPWHGESVIGGLAVLPSSGEVIAAAFDPIDGRAGKPYTGISNGLRASFSGGAIRLNNTTGDKVSGFNVYSSTGFGKAAGIGDMELTGELAPITIGNRLWDDTDSDGIQDADENGINGVVLELYQGTTKIGEATTTNAGQWYFDSTNVTLNGAKGLSPNTDYNVRIAANQFKDKGLGILNNFYLTKKDQNSSGEIDKADSDATYKDGHAVIYLKTGDLGYTNYSFDIGLTQNPPCTFTNSGIDSIKCNDNNTPKDGIDDYISFVLNPVGVGLAATYKVTSTSGTVTPATATAGVATEFRLQNGSAGGGSNFVIRIENPTDTSCNTLAIIEDTGNCKLVCTPITYPFCPGDVYRLEIEDPTFVQVQWYLDRGKGAGKQLIAGANALTYEASEEGVYTYTALNSAGCPSEECCPITLELSNNCCKPKICAPVKMVKKK